ncbi:MAG: hypothetical protein HQM13_15550 [SAR324 cluster bacterium]|nr:hypothetical protein [SAR324 cluster bacterium]
MIIVLSLLLFIATVLVIAYPLYFQKVSEYISGNENSSDFNEQDSLLSALTDLEEEYQLGRISNEDYQRLKLHFQRKYLHQKKPGSSKNS